jgi:hypothetical protein
MTMKTFSSETSVLTIATQQRIPKYGILQGKEPLGDVEQGNCLQQVGGHL